MESESAGLPLSYDEWEARAKQVLSNALFAYVTGGAGDDETVEANREAFRRWRLKGRLLRDVSKAQLTTRFLGMEIAAPIVLCPTGSQRVLSPEGELATARAAAAEGIPPVISTHASTPIEAIAQAIGNAPRIFELYPNKDREVMASFLHRAKASGYKAIVVESNEGRKYPRYSMIGAGVGDILKGYQTPVYFSDPVFRSRLKDSPENDQETALKVWHEMDHSLNFTWKDIKFIRDETDLPVVLKGILDARDVELAVSAGLAGVIVSNYGGRRLPGQIAALDALPAIAEAAKGRLEILIDGGVRSGVDAVKALALGADAVMIGRAFLFGLAVAGERGVRAVLRSMKTEIDSALGILGCNKVDELDRTVIEKF